MKKTHPSKPRKDPGLFLVIHGHFYQPPRENPWLGTVDPQDSASPHHDWNERIALQCYGPNSASRILDGSGAIELLVSNYEQMSFNFGPTLLSWLQTNQPRTYRAIVEADRASRARLNGHGNALAQNYNHVIMPLADPIDKRTQVVWGKADFVSRYGREPEGMWLAETAIDLPTARELVEGGIEFTVLAPSQARRARSLAKGSGWIDVSDGSIDPTRSYRLFPFPQDRKRHLDVFFYDSPVARAVAFEHLVRSADAFFDRLAGAAPHDLSRPVLVNVATDGESYGHHEPFGDMCLSYLFNRKLPGTRMKTSNYGHFLSIAPPEHEVELHDVSAWSCSHGVGRWELDCGCNAGRAGWHQRWRRPLREGLDHLREELRSIYLKETSSLFADPWEARDQYIHVLLAGGTEQARLSFLDRAGYRGSTPSDRARAMRLLESQKYAMFMYTSCGWFFDDISGLEPVQNLRYALRAIELAQPYSRRDLQAVLEHFLRYAPANHHAVRDGADVLTKYAAAVRYGPEQVVAGYALGATHLPDSERLSYPEWLPSEIQVEPPISPFPVHLVGQRRPFQRAHPGRVRVREGSTGQESAYDVLVLEGEGVKASCLVASGCSPEGELRRSLDGLSSAERQEQLAIRFGRGYFRLRDIPEETAARVRQRLLTRHLRPVAGRLEEELREQEGLISSMHEEGRPLPSLLINVARAVTQERLEGIGQEVGHLEPEEFLGRVEETYLIAGLAGITPDPRAISGPLSALFLRFVKEAARCWSERKLDRMMLLDNRIRALLTLSESREIPISRTSAEETLYFALKESGPEMEAALAGTGETRRAAELMMALAQRVNLSPRVLGKKRAP